MFWKKKTFKAPHGVPLHELELTLAPTTIKATRKGENLLLAKHAHYTVKVEVLPSDGRESENGPIRAAVQITSELPAQIRQIFSGKGQNAICGFNAFAALSALYIDNGKLLNGSRLTIYEEEDSWSTLHLPLLLYTIIAGNEPILGALRRTFGGEPPRGGDSEWSEQDLEQVQSYLASICVCTTGGSGLTAEFPLAAGVVSAVAGNRETALFQLITDQPHPELGGGLFCLLQMPQQIDEPAKLQSVCAQLNKLEMEAADLPPHFGAWCEGRLGGNPAYVSFLPNSLHNIPGIAVNTAFWAANRANWANRMLVSMGFAPS
jgi:hypothetical protein